MWKIPGRTSRLLLGGLFFEGWGCVCVWGGGGCVLEGKKRADKLDLVRLGASAVWSEISSQSFSKKRGREGRGGLLQFHKTFQSFFFTVLGALWGLYWELSQYLSRSNSLHTRKYRFIVIVIVLLPNIATQTIKKNIFYSNTCLQ